MKITRVEAFKLEIPFRERIVTSFTQYDNMEGLIVRIFAGDHFGVAETTAVASHSGQSVGSILAALEHMVPLVLGEDPRAIRRIHEKMNHIDENSAAKAAIDIACHDLAAKYYKVPLATLLGGLIQENFRTEHLVPIKPLEETVAYTKQIVEEGYSIYELKVKGSEDDLKRVHATLECLKPNSEVVIDFNRAGNPLTVKRFMDALDSQQMIIYIEQPTGSLAETAEVRKNSRFPIIADELIKSLGDTVKVVNANAADLLSIKLLIVGGFLPAMEIASYAAAMGVPFRVDDMCVSRFGNTASYVLASVLHSIVNGTSTHSLLVDHEDIVPEGVVLDNGIAKLKQQPGIGSTIDFSKLGDTVAAWAL